MAIHLGIYRPNKGGFGVYIRGLSGIALDYFAEEGKISLSSQAESKVSTKSERLKFTNSALAAKNWIARFQTLTEKEQLSRVGNKSIWLFSPKTVAIRVRYYKLIVNGIQKATSPRISELEKLGSIFRDYSIVPSVSRTHVISESEYEQIKHELEVLPALPKSKRENQFENRINSFKIPFNSNIK